MEKIISIVIPTLNRRNYLAFTLEHLTPQVERNGNNVELIVCNNASDDGTDDFMKELVSSKPYIGYYYFENRVDIFDSFSRSIEKSNGKYVIIWGDDDLPSPFLLESLLDSIKKNKNIGLIHFNRIMGYDLNPSLSSLKMCHRVYDSPSALYDVNTFINNFFLDATFISSIIFIRSAWEKGKSFNTKRHYGYEFLGIIYSGIRDMDCLYINYPLCIQRIPLTRDWMKQWPLYSLIGIPNMMLDLENEGILKNGLKYWHDTINKNFKIYFYTLIWASAFKEQYRSKCTEINTYQRNYFRKILTYFVIYFVPSFMFMVLRKVYFKSKE